MDAGTVITVNPPKIFGFPKKDEYCFSEIPGPAIIEMITNIPKTATIAVHNYANIFFFSTGASARCNAGIMPANITAIAQ